VGLIFKALQPSAAPDRLFIWWVGFDGTPAVDHDRLIWVVAAVVITLLTTRMTVGRGGGERSRVPLGNGILMRHRLAQGREMVVPVAIYGPPAGRMRSRSVWPWVAKRPAPSGFRYAVRKPA